MKIALIGTRGVPARYGGFETAVEEVGARLVEAGCEVVVFCRPAGGHGPSTYRGMRLVNLPAVRKRALETLSHTALSVTHAELAGVDAAILFNAANSPLLPVLHARGIPVATHVDGLEWRRSKWGPFGRRYYRVAESLAVRWSDALIADARGIADYYRHEFGADTRLITYGAPRVAAASDRLAELGLEPQEYLLAVARFEPENHVLEIIRGYSASGSPLPLVVVGSAPYSDEYSAQLRDAAGDNVRLLGGIWDQQLLDQLYANAAVYLHGHSVGGTNPSLLRAVGAATPTIAFDCIFNREVLGEAGWYFRGADDLAGVIATATASRDVLDARSAQLDAVAGRYDWDQVAAEYLQLCRDLAEGVRMPRATGRRRRPGWEEELASGSGEPVLMAHPSPDLYGSDRMLLESVSAFVERGRPVTVALPASGPLADLLTEAGAEVALVPTPVLRKSALKPLGLLRLAGEALSGLGPMLRLLRTQRPGVVYVSTLTIPWWIVVPRLAGHSVVCHVHEAEKSVSRSVRRLLYSPLFLAQRILVNSGFSEDVMVDTWPLLARRTELLYNGVPGPETVVEPRGRVTEPRLLFLGRLSPRKGPQVAVAALDELRRSGIRAHLTLLGAVFPGYEWFEKELHEQVARLGLVDQVEFAGFHPDVWPHIAAADIVIVPSTVDEPFGNTAVEAILAGRPLVVSRTSGLVEAASGYRAARFVEPGDEHDLAEAVAGLVQNWDQVLCDLRRDREVAAERHSLARYRRRVAMLCEPKPVLDRQQRTTGG